MGYFGIEDLRYANQLPPNDEGREWFVAHTKPRCEKKLAKYCINAKIPVTLALYKSVKRYPTKVITFLKPLFPGYVFLRLFPDEKNMALKSNCIVNLLKVIDQNHFEQQLSDIFFALEKDVEIRLAQNIGPGCWVRIKSGPLQGLTGWVEKRSGITEILLRLDFIGQAAAIRVNAEDIELI